MAIQQSHLLALRPSSAGRYTAFIFLIMMARCKLLQNA